MAIAHLPIASPESHPESSEVLHGIEGESRELFKANNPVRSRKYVPPPRDNERDALLIIRRECSKEEKHTASSQLVAHMKQAYWETGATL